MQPSLFRTSKWPTALISFSCNTCIVSCDCITKCIFVWTQVVNKLLLLLLLVSNFTVWNIRRNFTIQYLSRYVQNSKRVSNNNILPSIIHEISGIIQIALSRLRPSVRGIRYPFETAYVELSNDNENPTHQIVLWHDHRKWRKVIEHIIYGAEWWMYGSVD